MTSLLIVNKSNWNCYIEDESQYFVNKASLGHLLIHTKVQRKVWIFRSLKNEKLKKKSNLIK